MATAWEKARGTPALAREALVALVRQPGTRRRAWIVLAGVLVLAYAAGVLGYVLITPEIGARCAFTPVVNHFYPDFLFPEDQEPLRPGDKIVEVAGRPVENWSQLLRRVHLLRQEPPWPVAGLSAHDLVGEKAPAEHPFVEMDGVRVVRVVYERPGEEDRRVVWCKLGSAPVETLVPSVLWFFLKIGLFVVGAIVFWKRTDDRPASRFFWLCTVSFGAYMGGYHWSRIVTQPVLLVVFMLCALMLPAVTLHFYLVFPRPKRFLQRHGNWVLLGVYGLPVVFFLLLLSGYLRVRWLYQGGPGLGLLLVEILYEIYCYFTIAALWYLASLASLIHSYRSAANPTERNQVKWILLGCLAAAGPIGYSLYLAFWEQGRFGGGAATWPMFLASAFVTGAYTISITRYRLMQLDQIVSSGVMYFLISFLAGLFYYGLVFAGVALVGSRVGEAPTLPHVLAVSSTALVLMVVLDLARGRLKRALDRHFRREKHQLDRTLQRMSQAIDRLVDPPTLARRLLHTSCDLLGVARGAVYLRQGDPPLYKLAEAVGEGLPLAELPPGCPLVEALQARGTLGPHPLPGAGAALSPVGGPAQRQLHFLEGEVAQGLLHEGQLLGLLVLGPRESGAYTPEDVQLLAAFAQITGLALVSAETHRLMERLNLELKAKVEKIAEQQRRILALQSQLNRRSEEVQSAEGKAQAEEAQEEAAAPAPAAPAPEGLVGSSPQVQNLLHLVRRVAASSSAVLLRGESGTGKELLARALHESSPRAQKPFIKVHCAALAPGLLESELFGHVKGAFTSAIRDKVGRFELADGGTLLLDEIGDISLEVQTKLLRVLEEMTFERVGSTEPVKVDVRIVAATHQNLEAMIEQGRFREDLYYRLNVVCITLPALRQRLEDVPELVQHFLRIYGQRTGKSVSSIDDDALAVLKAYPWPGNIRELENAIEHAVVVAEGPTLTPNELPEKIRQAVAMGAGRAESGEERPGEEAREGTGSEGAAEDPVVSAALTGSASLAEVASAIEAERAERLRREREQLVRALAAAGGNKAEAARALGLARSTLISRLKKLGLG